MRSCLERSAASSPFNKITGWDRVSPTRHLGPHHHELVRVRIRHRLKHRIDHAEDRRRRSNAQRQRQDRGDREALVLEQRAYRVADVLSKSAPNMNFVTLDFCVICGGLTRLSTPLTDRLSSRGARACNTPPATPSTSSTGIAVNTTGSVALTSNNKLLIVRVNAKRRANPTHPPPSTTSLTQHRSPQHARLRAERKPDPKFFRATADVNRHRAVNTNRRERQREDRERRQQDVRQPLRAERLSDDLRHRSDQVQRHVGIDLPDRALNVEIAARGGPSVRTTNDARRSGLGHRESTCAAASLPRD